MAKEAKPATNEFDERALWLRAATDALRDQFAKSDLPLPEKIRFGFSTKGKGTQKTSEAWHSEASVDASYEVFIRADQDNPVAILGFLVRELTHIALPASDSHGLKYKAAATKIGLIGKMRAAVPGPLLQSRLEALADDLGPLPHRSLDITWSQFVRKKKDGIRMLRAHCPGGKNSDTGEFEECGYNIRLTAKWANQYGAVCPRHGPLAVEFPSAGDSGELEATPDREALT